MVGKSVVIAEDGTLNELGRRLLRTHAAVDGNKQLICPI
jgi:hypothetical protein